MTRPTQDRKHAARVVVIRQVRPTERVVREGTTGRVVECLPRVWAVASPRPQRCRGNKHPNPPVRVPVAVSQAVAQSTSGEPDSPPPELAFYRKYTQALLRRYMRLSMGAGRVPSLIGRELFRGNVTHYRVHGLEDVVIFCHDVEKRLQQLKDLDRELIKRVGLQQFSQGEAAVMLGISLRNCVRQYAEALDRLTLWFLKDRLLEIQKCCQEGKSPHLEINV